MVSSKASAIILTTLTAAQLLLYPVACLAAQVADLDITVTALLHTLSFINASRLPNYLDTNWYVMLVAVTLAWMLLVCSLFVVVAWRLMKHRAQSRGMLRLLRALFRVSVTVLFMPLSGIALSWLNCPANDDIIPGGCWGTFHVFVIAGFALTMPVFVAISVLVSML